jgi:hypothetical protein
MNKLILIILILIFHCSTSKNRESVLLYTDKMLNGDEKLILNSNETLLSSKPFTYQKCYLKSNFFYNDSIFVNFFEFANQLKQEYPESNAIKDLDVIETVHYLDDNILYRILFYETCFKYSGMPIIISRQ